MIRIPLTRRRTAVVFSSGREGTVASREITIKIKRVRKLTWSQGVDIQIRLTSW